VFFFFYFIFILLQARIRENILTNKIDKKKLISSMRNIIKIN